jgi:EAL domain-containing protein (putative c-di-GMP-specific phosphodiesterase class I)
VLKVDRSFVTDLASNADDASIVQAVVSMAHSLRLKVIAEGVETSEQLELLRGLGCDQFQGFHHSEPVDAAGAARFMAHPAAAPRRKLPEPSIASA